VNDNRSIVLILSKKERSIFSLASRKMNLHSAADSVLHLSHIHHSWEGQTHQLNTANRLMSKKRVSEK
jgi:hypothetical protein